MNRIIHNLSGVTKTIMDLGIVLPAGGSFDVVSFDFDVIAQTEELFAGIDAGDYSLEVSGVIITDGEAARKYFRVVTEIFSSEVTVRNITLSNPTSMQFFIIANTLSLAFNHRAESIALESELQNTFVHFGSEYNRLDTWSNTALVDAMIQLDLTDAGTVVDECDSVAGISEVENASQGTVSVNADPAYGYSGSTSWKVARTSGDSRDEYIFLKTCSYNWSAVAHVALWIYGHGGERVRFYINSELVSGSEVVVKSGWQKHLIDVSGISGRSSVVNMGFGIIPGTAAVPFNTYFDSFRTVAGTTRYASGNVVTTTTTTDTDITHVYFYPFDSHPTGTTIVYKISLDDGDNWHVIEATEKSAWVDVSTWAEPFTSKNNLKVKVKLATTDTSITPVTDDFFVLYKVE